MHRFYLPPEQVRGEGLTLTGGEAHHGLRVLRLRRGERVLVLDGAGGEVTGEVSELGHDTLSLEVKERRFVPASPFQITLIQAIPKGKIIENIIQKATELEVARVIPLLSARVISDFDAPRAETKAAHWRQVAIGAIKQCGSPWLPRIDTPVTPGELLARGEAFELSLIGSLQPGSRHPREWFKEFRAARGRAPVAVSVWVGPEGDFTAEEIAAAEGSGARPITLGRLVLRSETAAIYCLSVLNYELHALGE